MATRQINGAVAWNELVVSVENAIKHGDPAFYQKIKIKGGLENYTYQNSGADWDEATEPSWFDGIRIFIINKTPQLFLKADNYGTIPGVVCGMCNLPTTFQGIQIDHNSGWKNMIISWKRPGCTMTKLEARIAYNSPHMLRAL
jgi:hypothetical protein